MIKIENLDKHYKNVHAVDNVSFEVKSGEIFGFIGPNGAGKSTTIRCIMNMLSYDGKIYIDDKLINKHDYDYKNDIGYLPSEIHLYSDLSVKGIIDYSISFYNSKRKDINKLIERLNVPLNKNIEELSLGNLKKVGIILSLIHNPKILILDEPTSGLDPLIQEEFYEILKEEKKKGTTIFLSSHNLGEVKRICDRVAIIKEGKIIGIDKVDKLFSVNFIQVKLETKDIDKVNRIKEFNVKYIDNNTIIFIYNGTPNELIKLLKDINISKILIEEPSIEEIFMHYYK